MTAMRESLFSKLDRDIKTILGKQSASDNLNNQNLQVASEQFLSHKRYTGEQFTNMTDQIAVLQAKIDDQNMKVATYMRTVDNLKSARVSVPEGSQLSIAAGVDQST